MNVYVETCIFHKAKSLFDNKGMIFLTGPEYSGKTSMAYALARSQLVLNKEPLILHYYEESR